MGLSIQGAHSALHPTFSWVSVSGKPVDLQDQVEMEAAARAMASLMNPAEVQRTVAGHCSSMMGNGLKPFKTH